MKVNVEANSGAFEFTCESGERILYAGLGQGLDLPYECATGTCGTCRGRIVAGAARVDWNEAPGFARLKREKGDILMCQARPTTDLTLRVPAKIAPYANPDTVPTYRIGRVENVRTLVPDVIDFELALSRPITFDAGQYVVLEADGIEGGRAYSMVNFERATSRLQLVVKQKPGGKFSDRLFGTGLTGQQLAVFGPLGRATFRTEEAKDVLCIAGGSGLAGMMAILAHAVRENYFRERRGHVFFGVRTLPDAFYQAELAQLAALAHGNLQVTLALSHASAESAVHPEFSAIRLAAGMVNDVAAHAMAAGGYDNMVAFVAGPPMMVDGALRFLTHEAKLSRTFIRYDKFA